MFARPEAMRLIVDAQMPGAREVFSRFGDVEVRPAEEIRPAGVREADVLLVRSVTRVDEELLGGSSVRFVGSATIGTDHVDLEFLEHRGIVFAHAPGAGAGSVADYVVAAVLAVYADRGLESAGRTAGVIGLGNTGARVARRLAALGMHVLRNDPPLARGGGVGGGFLPLAEVLARSDVVSLHVPLTRAGADPTWHLLGREELADMRREALVINTARGAVVDNLALADALGKGRLGGAVLDVWEGEPFPLPQLIEASTLATPHIAGYSLDGKIEGTLSLAEALARWTGSTAPIPPIRGLEPDPPLIARAPQDGRVGVAWLDAVARTMYDIRGDDSRMRPLASLTSDERARRFRELRSTYPERRGFEWFRLDGAVPVGLGEALSGALGLRPVEEAQR